MLQTMVQRVIAGQRQMQEDVEELKTRSGRVERHVAGVHVDVAEMSSRMDRIDSRLARIEIRLGLIEA
jgi:hypothetical protein